MLFVPRLRPEVRDAVDRAIDERGRYGDQFCDQPENS